MTHIAFFCYSHRNFKYIVDYYCRNPRLGYKVVKDSVANPVFLKPDGTMICISYIRDGNSVRGRVFDKICIEEGLEWNDTHRYCLEIIAGRLNKAYSDLFNYATRVPYPNTPEHIRKRNLKILRGLGT